MSSLTNVSSSASNNDANANSASERRQKTPTHKHSMIRGQASVATTPLLAPSLSNEDAKNGPTYPANVSRNMSTTPYLQHQYEYGHQRMNSHPQGPYPSHSSLLNSQKFSHHQHGSGSNHNHAPHLRQPSLNGHLRAPAHQHGHHPQHQQQHRHGKPEPFVPLSSTQMLIMLNATSSAEESINKASAALALSALAGTKRTLSPTCVSETANLNDSKANVGGTKKSSGSMNGNGSSSEVVKSTPTSASTSVFLPSSSPSEETQTQISTSGSTDTPRIPTPSPSAPRSDQDPSKSTFSNNNSSSTPSNSNADPNTNANMSDNPNSNNEKSNLATPFARSTKRMKLSHHDPHPTKSHPSATPTPSHNHAHVHCHGHNSHVQVHTPSYNHNQHPYNLHREHHLAHIQQQQQPSQQHNHHQFHGTQAPAFMHHAHQQHHNHHRHHPHHPHHYHMAPGLSMPHSGSFNTMSPIQPLGSLSSSTPRQVSIDNSGATAGNGAINSMPSRPMKMPATPLQMRGHPHGHPNASSHLHGHNQLHGHNHHHGHRRVPPHPMSLSSPMAVAQSNGGSPMMIPSSAISTCVNDGSYKRKDKSLGVLCVNFMMRYNKLKQENPGEIPAVSIDEAAQSLSVERRRIYDIINILEAIKIVSRKCKNTYNWHGMEHIMETFNEMQNEAVTLFPEDAARNGFERVEEAKIDTSKEGSTNSSPVRKNNMASGLAMLLASVEQVETGSSPKSVTSTDSSPTSKNKKKPVSKEKSLGRLSQKFIQLFLIGNETIALNDASDKILGKTEVPPPPMGASAVDIVRARNSANKMLKTKIRRLYDIANVMSSIGLITKLNGGNNLSNAARNRPSFKWIYPLTAQEIWAKNGNGTVDTKRDSGTATTSPPTKNDSIGKDHQGQISSS